MCIMKFYKPEVKNYESELVTLNKNNKTFHLFLILSKKKIQQVQRNVCIGAKKILISCTMTCTFYDNDLHILHLRAHVLKN